MHKKYNVNFYYKIIISISYILFIKHVLFISKIHAGDIDKLNVVVIDAGHGGEDPGALGKHHKEKDITLAIALKVEQFIKEQHPSVKVILTRSTDVFIPLHERANIANKNNADLFISIHANANKKTEVSGMETYAMGLHTNEKNLEVAMKENAAITFEKDYSLHYEGYDPNSTESFIIFSLMQNTYLAQSLEFANRVQQFGQKITNRIDRGVKQAGFLVLWRTTMPSVLIEVGYITNPEEEKYLASLEGQTQIAKAIAHAFTDYKNFIERRSFISLEPMKNNISDTPKIQRIDTSAISLKTDSIQFKIQLFSVPRRLEQNSPELIKCKKKLNVEIIDELFSNNMYKYAIGNYSTYNETVAASKEIKKYYPEAFVIAVKNGIIIPLSEAIKSKN